MGFFTKIFKRKEAEVPQAPAVEMSQECMDLLRLKDNIDTAVSTECYIARSEVADLIPEFEAVVNHFEVLRKSGMMAAYCEKNGLSLSIAESALESYQHLYDLLDSHNESYIQNTMASEKTYLDNILREVDPQIMLDDDLRRVVLTDEDYCLVIAGAGAGKTTTVAAKVKYLVEKKNVDPSQILVVSFTNKAVQELRDKLNRDLKIDCPIATFHSTGNAILRKKSPEKLNIVDDSKLYFVIQDYFKKSILKNESMVNNLILFFASYFDAPYEGQDLNAFFNKVAKTNFATLRSDLNEFRREIIDTRTKKSITIQSEVLRSHQEVEIAKLPLSERHRLRIRTPVQIRYRPRSQALHPGFPHPSGRTYCLPGAFWHLPGWQKQPLQ